MFTYFWCRWIFRIIFTSINLFYYTLKICINNKRCFIRLLILIKVGLSPSKKICVICLIESPLKIMKNAFCFILKALFFSRYLRFCHDFLVKKCIKNGLIRKIRLTSKFMTSQPGSQTIAIHIFSDISQSKGNQTMRFGQLIEYNKRNIFLEKLCGTWGREASSSLFIFLKELNMRWKQVICSLVSIYFDSPLLAIRWKQTL